MNEENQEGLVFADKASPNTHVYVGVWRPPHEEIQKKCLEDYREAVKKGASDCYIGFDTHSYGSMGNSRWIKELWNDGFWDKPLYKRVV